MADAPIFLDRLIADGRLFRLAFIDHWHGYKETHDALVRMGALLEPGSFVVMHDYNDRSSLDPDHAHKVIQAAGDTIDKDPAFRFVWVVASIAVFQKI